MKNFAALLVGLCATGCYGAAWDRTEVPPPPVAAADGAEWQYYCTYNGTNDLGELTAWLNQLGARGWELVGVGGRNITTYCFKMRRAASAPSPVAPVPPPATAP